MDYVRRLVDPLLDELFADLPAVLLVGPRACGKTTTARRRVVDVLALDVARDAAVTRVDADEQLRVRDRPLLIDEWQQVPEILGAVKRAVDADFGAGQFLITGSTAADLGSAGWPATGRIVRLPMWPLVERELTGDVAAESLVDRLARDGVLALQLAGRAPGVRDYVELALRGGQPEVVTRTGRSRAQMLASHVDQVTGHDVAMAGFERDPVRLRRYLQACAINSAGVVHHKTLYDAAGVTRVTGSSYDDVLAATHVIDLVPAWSGGRLQRLVSSPKRYLTDPGLLGPLLGVDARSVLRDDDLLGRVLDTFVAAQLRAEVVVAQPGTRLHHLRDAEGRHEVDLLIEVPGGGLIGVEVKSSSAPSRADARHLAWLRDKVGDRFLAGVVFHTGAGIQQWGDRLAAAPICCLWSG